MPSGFLGTRGDALMDLVVLSFALILPILAWSYREAQARAYAKHKRIQLILASVLAVVIVVFETDMRLSGGIFEMTKHSRFAHTTLLNASIGIHVLLSIATTILWLVLIPLSMRRFPNPPKPSPFSRAHRLWGTIGMITMALTGITGVELYVVGFAF